MNYRLTEAADDDITDVLRETNRQFGSLQRERYAALIERAIEMVAEAPERPGSRQRDDPATGVRSFHIEIAAGRRGAAAHVVYYLRGRLDDGRDGVIIARLLHERMEPLRHLSRGLP
ncbi:MAG: type II toxin-antitoxin system RelE/ParE family toxin [Stellaceae bacterium]